MATGVKGSLEGNHTHIRLRTTALKSYRNRQKRYISGVFQKNSTCNKLNWFRLEDSQTMKR